MGIFTIKELQEETKVAYTLEKPEAVNERLMKNLREGADPVLISLERELFRKTVLHATVPKTWNLLSRALRETKTWEEETSLILLLCRELKKCKEKGLEIRNLELQPERMYVTPEGELRMFFWPIVNRKESVSAGLFFSSLPLSEEITSPEGKAFETEFTRLLQNPEQVTAVMVERFVKDFVGRQGDNTSKAAPEVASVQQAVSYDPFAASAPPTWSATSAPVSPPDAGLAAGESEEDEGEEGGTSVLGAGDFFSFKTVETPPPPKPNTAYTAPFTEQAPNHGATPGGTLLSEWQPVTPPTGSPLEQAAMACGEETEDAEEETGGTSVLGLGESLAPAASVTPPSPVWSPAPSAVKAPVTPPAPDWPAAPSAAPKASVMPPPLDWLVAPTAQAPLMSPLEAAAFSQGAQPETGMKEVPSEDEEAPTALLQEESHPNSYLIRVTTGEKIFLTGNAFTIGKRETCSYVIRDNKYISHLHAELRRRENGWGLVDKGSANKTRLDGRVLVPETEEPLPQTCVIRLANEDFRFVAGE